MYEIKIKKSAKKDLDDLDDKMYVHRCSDKRLNKWTLTSI